MRIFYNEYFWWISWEAVKALAGPVVLYFILQWWISLPQPTGYVWWLFECCQWVGWGVFGVVSIKENERHKEYRSVYRPNG